MCDNSYMQLSVESCRELQCVRCWRDKSGWVSGFDWDSRGNSLIASADDDTLHLYSLESVGMKSEINSTKNLQFSQGCEEVPLFLQSSIRLPKPESIKTLHSKKYGVHTPKFLSRSCCLCASRNHLGIHDFPYALRMWDLQENRYLRCFPLPCPVLRGNGISNVPGRSLVLCTCTDGGVRLFSLEKEQPLKLFQHPSISANDLTASTRTAEKRKERQCFASFDSQGDSFCICFGDGLVQFYDPCAYRQPFLQMSIRRYLRVSRTQNKSVLFHGAGRNSNVTLYGSEQEDQHLQENISSLTYAPDASHILIGTTHQRYLAINSFTGELMREYRSSDQIKGGESTDIDNEVEKESPRKHDDFFIAPLDCSEKSLFPCFSPDSSFLFCGDKRGCINIWSVVDGKKICELWGHEGPPQFVSFNPSKAILASACVNVALWMPEKNRVKALL